MEDGTSDRAYVPPIDPTYGQRSALPDLEDNEGGESIEEAMAYLRGVRSEASLIPHLLVSRDKTIEQSDPKDLRGYYQDGAYHGVDGSEDDYDEWEQLASSNQLACSDAIRQRFHDTRLELNRIPPLASPATKSQSLALSPHANHAQYNHAFMYTSPATGEIARITQDTVMFALKRYESVLTKRNFTVGETERTNLGAWGWALLAKCRPSQQMDGEDIAVVREIGKTAIRILNKIRHDWRGLNPVDDLRLEEHMTQRDGPATKDNLEMDGAVGDGNEQDGTAQDAKQDSDLDHPMADAQEDILDQQRTVIAALDILIAIVGEEFGQRDLLWSRESW